MHKGPREAHNAVIVVRTTLNTFLDHNSVAANDHMEHSLEVFGHRSPEAVEDNLRLQQVELLYFESGSF